MKEEVKVVPDIEPYTGKKMVPINQYGLDGKYVKSFDSIEQASEEVGITFSEIRMCLIGVVKSAGGFQWKVKQ